MRYYYLYIVQRLCLFSGQRRKDLISHDEHTGSTEDHLVAHLVLLDVGFAGVVGCSGLTPHGGNVQFLGCFEDTKGDLSVDDQTQITLEGWTFSPWEE